MTLKGHFGKKADIGGPTGMAAAAGSLMAESVGAGEVWCEGGDDGDEAGRIGDIGRAGNAGDSAVAEAGKVSNSTGGASSHSIQMHRASECLQQQARSVAT
jgi:hypothetical protein